MKKIWNLGLFVQGSFFVGSLVIMLSLPTTLLAIPGQTEFKDEIHDLLGFEDNKAEIKKQVKINKARYKVLEAIQKQEKPVSFTKKETIELDFSIDGLAMFARTGKIDDEGLKTLILLRMKGEFALLYSQMKVLLNDKIIGQKMDRALVRLIKSCGKHSLHRTILMAYKQLTHTMKYNSKVVAYIVNLCSNDEQIRKNEQIDELKNLLTEVYRYVPFYPGLFPLIHPVYVEDLSNDALTIDHINGFDRGANFLICKERTKIFYPMWWSYFDGFGSKKHSGKMLTMESSGGEGTFVNSNCVKVIADYRKKGLILDDFIPLRSCELYQQVLKNGRQTLFCQYHLCADKIMAKPPMDMNLMEYIVPDVIIDEALNRGFKEKNIWPYLGAILYELHHKPEMTKKALNASLTLLNAPVHSSYKCLVLRNLAPSMIKSSADSPELIDWLIKTVGQKKYKKMAAYAAVNLMVLYCGDIDSLKKIKFSKDIEKSFNNLSIGYAPSGKDEYTKHWTPIISKTMKRIRVAQKSMKK